ncbi:MAG: NfeD family protein [Planctomycetota bacterium]|jgi:membrane-bound serine protease (ClpP class)
MTLAILLVVASLCLFVLEVLVVSFGAITIAAVGLGAAGVFFAFKVSTVFGWTMIGTLVVGVPLVLKGAFALMHKLPWTRGFYLSRQNLKDEERRAGAQIDRELLGREGLATSPLRPAGNAEIDGQPLQVVSTGSMVDPGTRVRVVDITGNRIVVEEIDA